MLISVICTETVSCTLPLWIDLQGRVLFSIPCAFVAKIEVIHLQHDLPATIYVNAAREVTTSTPISQ